MSQSKELPLDQIINGDCVEVMKEHIPDASIDCIVSDFPYGLSIMGENWDQNTPEQAAFNECYRVLKPGAFAFIMSSPRSDIHLEMLLKLKTAGFRMDLPQLYWTFSNGFPKATSVAKVIDKRQGTFVEGEPTKNARFDSKAIQSKTGNFSHAKVTHSFEPQSEEAKKFATAYLGYQPKPAIEIIVAVMKPLSKDSFIDQVLDNGHGATWLGEGRIPFENPGDKLDAAKKNTYWGEELRSERGGAGLEISNWKQPRGKYISRPEGRFPGNLLVSDDVLNKNGNEKANSTHYSSQLKKSPYGGGWKSMEDQGSFTETDASFSRYFSLDQWALYSPFGERIRKLPEQVRRTFPFLIVPKPPMSEKEQGLEMWIPVDGVSRNEYNQRCKVCNLWKVVRSDSGETSCQCPAPNFESVGYRRRCIHNTVKPINLMSYLITIGSREGDVVLDPFLGSGTTMIASKILDRHFIGIELGSYDCEVAQHRLDSLSQSLTVFVGGTAE